MSPDAYAVTVLLLTMTLCVLLWAYLVDGDDDD